MCMGKMTLGKWLLVEKLNDGRGKVLFVFNEISLLLCLVLVEEKIITMMRLKFLLKKCILIFFINNKDN